LQGTIAQAAALAIFGNDILRGYSRENFDQGRPHIPLQTKSLTALRQDLMTVLSGIEAFAARHKLEHFAGAFRKATGLLSSDHPLAETYHPDLAPTAAMPLEAKQLLGAVQAAWVFGGMGTWNDLGFDGDDQRENDALSGELFLLLNQTLCSAINTTSGAAGP
jgi:hypothetical protein